MSDIKKLYGSRRINNILVHQKEIIRGELRVFQSYLSDFRLTLCEYQSDFFNETANVIFDNKDDEDRFDAYYHEESEKFFKTYPQLFYNSLLITYYSYFEGRLLRLNELLKKYDKSREGHKIFDNKGKIIYNFRKILEVNYSLDIDAVNESWNRIEEYGKVRNMIIHNNSNFKEGYSIARVEKNINLLERFAHIKMDNFSGGFYISSDEFLSILLYNIESCLIYIYNEVEKSISKLCSDDLN
ncbi:hypothetical protein GCQ56_00855 [Marinifilum sp. N1E240]|uniref:hypothetical protein n=1 Tax=Marinifilum sp. N1E240 TaxID=2608082 RepID=UPI00128E76D6|nr:hypothetical protein [Marinifilum sp. N1E240]MPQ45541.1 hypothetical protein [Marinifilum sp. N1E240]